MSQVLYPGVTFTIHLDLGQYLMVGKKVKGLSIKYF